MERLPLTPECPPGIVVITMQSSPFGFVSSWCHLHFRFCVVDAKHKEECLQRLPLLMENVLQVPLLARFAVFGKRRSKKTDQVKLRIFCMTEPGERQTLEEMQNFQELAKGPVVEVRLLSFVLLLRFPIISSQYLTAEWRLPDFDFAFGKPGNYQRRWVSD